MLKNLIFILLLVSQAAFANWSVEAHLYTQHFMDIGRVDENEKNYGLGLRYQFSEKWALLAGKYRNSLTSHTLSCGESTCQWEPEYLNSHYVSLERIIYRGEDYEFGLGAGVADGYKDLIDQNGKRLSTDDDYQPMAGPYLNIGNKYSVKIRYMFELASMSAQYSF